MALAISLLGGTNPPGRSAPARVAQFLGYLLRGSLQVRHPGLPTAFDGSGDRQSRRHVARAIVEQNTDTPDVNLRLLVVQGVTLPYGLVALRDEARQGRDGVAGV